MKIDWNVVLAVFIGLLLFKVADKMLITPLLQKTGMWEEDI